MTYNLGALAPALDTYLRALQAAVDFNDPNLSPQGMAERHRHMVTAAQAALSAQMPAELPVPDRAPVLDALRAHTADQVALQSREREKVGALLDAGKPLGGIIRGASLDRLAAIADMAETLPEVLADESGAIAAEIADAIFTRLVALGNPDAVQVAQQEAAAAPIVAARALLADTLANGTPTYDGLVAVHAVDSTLYNLLADGIRHVDAPAIDRLVKQVRVAEERGVLV